MLDGATLAHGLSDSPAGLLAWLLERWNAWSDNGGDVESVFTKDDLLTHATIYVSVLGDEAEQRDTMQALRRAKGLIKRDIGDWLRIRTVPEIAIKLDTSIERGTHILALMKGLEQEHQA